MYEASFLAGIGTNSKSKKSCDAIVIQLYVESEDRNVLIVVDAGYRSVGDDLVNHIYNYYGTDEVDLMISTHPDSDHINGLVNAIQQLKVKELMVHLPRVHFGDNADDISNIESVDDLEGYAEQQGTIITEPFMGETRFDEQVVILGPTSWFYEECMQAHINDEQEKSARLVTPSTLLESLTRLSRPTLAIINRILASLPIETLGNSNSTSSRNESSVISLIRAGKHKILLTGDSGPTGLDHAANFYEKAFGTFLESPLSIFQVPHHGSRHNLNQTTLDRIVGTHNNPYNPAMNAVISSAKESTKHPSPKITNALIRRGIARDRVAATNGITIISYEGRPARPGLSILGEYPILEE